jgi:creatinine amidohydrolase
MPIGSCEQHGPHLPLGTDIIDCYEVAKRVSAKTGVPHNSCSHIWMFTEPW